MMMISKGLTQKIVNIFSRLLLAIGLFPTAATPEPPSLGDASRPRRLTDSAELSDPWTP